MVVGEVEHGVPQAVEGHEPRGHEKQLFQGRFVVDRVLRKKGEKRREILITITEKYKQ